MKKIILIALGSVLLLSACDSASAEPKNTWVTPTTPFSSMEASPSR